MARRDHLPILDAMRFACALAVLAYHLCAVFPLAVSSVTHDFDPTLALPIKLAGITWWGWVGVDLFFVVSGYVIATSAAASAPATFVRRRALRLLPTAWICATLTALVLLLGSTMPADLVAARWATSLLLSPLGQPIDEIYWTLGVEVAFYALVTTLLRDRADNAPQLSAIGAGLAAASLAFWAAIFTGFVSLDPADTLIRLLLLPHGGFFATGIALHALAARRGGLLTWATLAGGMVAGGCEIVGLAATMRGVEAFDPDPLVPLAIFTAGVAVIAWAGRPGTRHAHPALATLGLATYPLYLLNQRFAAGVLTALCHTGVPVDGAVALTAVFVFALALGIATLVEPPLRRWLGARLSLRHAPAPDIRPSAFPPAG